MKLLTATRGVHRLPGPRAFGKVVDDMESASGWGPSGAETVGYSTDEKYSGTRSLHIVGAATNTTAFAVRAFAFNMRDIENVFFRVLIPYSQANGNDLLVRIDLTSDSFTSQLNGTATHVPPGVWFPVCIHKDEFVTAGTGATDFADLMTNVRIRLSALSGVVSEAYIDDFQVNYRQRGSFKFSADDGWNDLEVIHADLKDNDIPRLTAYITTSFVGQVNRTTLAALRTMHDDPACPLEINGHTVTHPNIRTAGAGGGAQTYAQILAEREACMNWQITNGFIRDDEHLHEAQPHGSHNPDLITALGALGMKTSRTTLEYRNAGLGNPYLLCGMIPDGTTETSTTWLAQFNAAMGAGVHMECVLHRIVAGDPSISSEINRTADWLPLLEGVADRYHNDGDFDFVHNTEMYRRLAVV